MELRGTQWMVVRNEVHRTDEVIPLPPLPTPVPPSQPCIAIFPPPPGCGGPTNPGASVSVTADREVYHPGDTIAATVTNTGSATLSGGGGYVCGMVEVVVARGEDVYEPAPGGADVCTAIAILLKPGESRTETFTLNQPGRYRVIVRASVEGGNGQTVVASDTFTVS
jgi:hypothetical protein